MRYLAWISIAAALAAGQQRESTTYVRDVNGRRVEWTEATAGLGRSSETVRNLNGRRVPVEQVEEKILKKGDGVLVVERILKRYDANGAPLPPEKQVVETVTRPDGSTVEKTTVFRGDLNGALRPVERSTTEARQRGEERTSETTVERGSLNGGFETMEKRSAREKVQEKDKSSERDETVYVRDANGSFIPASRQITRVREVDGVLLQQIDEYEAATTGALRLGRQRVGRTYKAPDGTERTEMDVFGPAAPGRAVDESAKLQLRERHVFTSRQSADGSVVTVFAVQRPSLNSPKELGPIQPVSETVTRKK